MTASTESQLEIPEGWAHARLRDVTQDVANLNPKDEPNRIYRYADISSVCNSTNRVIQHKSFSGRDAPSRARRPVEVNDVLFSNVRTNLRNVAIVEAESDIDLCSTGFTVLRSNGAVEPQFLFRYVLSDQFIDAITPQQRGELYPATTDRVVRDQFLPLPPLVEQQRIVKKVEALMMRAEAVKNSVMRAAATLSCFRQAVRSAACNGTLTLDWRTARGIPKEDWANLKVEELLASQLVNGRSVSDAPDGFPVLRLTCFKDGEINLSERKNGAWTKEEAARFLVSQHDFFVARGSGSISLVGRGGLVQSEPDDIAFPDTMIRIHTRNDLVAHRYLPIVWNSQMVREQIESVARTTAGIWKISQRDIMNFTIPVPPMEEQAEIVERVESLFKLARIVERCISAALARTDELTQAIYARAFRGDLVPNEAELARAEDRDYESAHQLLARVRGEGKLDDAAKVPQKKKKSTEKQAMPKLHRESVIAAIQAMPNDSFSFDDLRARLPGDYDRLREILFSLVDDDEVNLAHVFDEESQSMHFVRRKP